MTGVPNVMTAKVATICFAFEVAATLKTGVVAHPSATIKTLENKWWPRWPPPSATFRHHGGGRGGALPLGERHLATLVAAPPGDSRRHVGPMAQTSKRPATGKDRPVMHHHAARLPRSTTAARYQLRDLYQSRGLTELVIATGIHGRRLVDILDGAEPTAAERAVIARTLNIAADSWGRVA